MNGYIYANIWMQDHIIKINHSNGIVEQVYQMESLFPRAKRGHVDVFNGIAHNATDNSFLVTGKWWPKYYHVKLLDLVKNELR